MYKVKSGEWMANFSCTANSERLQQPRQTVATLLCFSCSTMTDFLYREILFSAAGNLVFRSWK